MILVVLLKLGFGSCVSSRDQALQANGVEGTISISSVRKKKGKREDHRICLSENLQHKGGVSRKMFNLAQVDFIFSDNLGLGSIWLWGSVHGSHMDVVAGQGLLSYYRKRSQGHYPKQRYLYDLHRFRRITSELPSYELGGGLSVSKPT